MKIRSNIVLLLFFAILFTGCAVTHIQSRVDSNPLKNIAEKAADDYSVIWIDDNTLKISDWWPTHSIFSLGYTAFHANLHYSEGLLNGDYYLQSNQLGLLFIPITIDAGKEFFGGALKPYMRSEIDEVLRFGGTSMQSSTVTHGVSKSVIK